MPNSRPLLLLDVDGVINDQEAVVLVRSHEDPEFAVERLGVTMIRSHGHWLAIPHHMPELIQSLVAESETWWCTTWRDRANDEIAEFLGVGPFPVVDDGRNTLGLQWKIESARELIADAVAAGRAVVWIEDFEELPKIPGVTLVDTTDAGVLHWSDVPLHVYE